ncbi:MAG TPA: hypothetical protein PLO00_11105 [Usitatibacteraceae bacterium]|nr:hypothetical protein [Usitatibacteraceae bacterium]
MISRSTPKPPTPCTGTGDCAIAPPMPGWAPHCHTDPSLRSATV